MVYPGLLDWIKKRKDPVYMQAERADVPASVAYPLKQITEKYGTWFLTSSVSMMLALALEQENLEELGLWGITMDHTEEYRAQKPGAHFFLQVAKMRGLKITVPPECELLTDGGVYLYNRNHRLYSKVIARKEEFQRRVAELQVVKQRAIMTKTMLTGALTLSMTKEEMEAEMAKVDAQLPGFERDLLTLDGALQLIDHIEKNWLEEAL